jgi:hypothetical protein
MITKKVPYKPSREYLFLDQKRKLGIVNRIQKQITKFELSKESFEFVTG